MRARDSILVTGGAGYIGSHLVRAAVESGSRVTVIDRVLGGSIEDRVEVVKVCAAQRVTSCVHLAARILVGESIERPADYWQTNVAGTITLLDALRATSVQRIVFGSSAAAAAPTSPYGMTKLAGEQLIASYARAYGMRWAALRFFNVAGAHPDGTLRERHDPETHLVPLVVDVHLGRRGPLTIYDASLSRDYVHVCDVADAILAALDVLDARDLEVRDVGTGLATSTGDLVARAGELYGRAIPSCLGSRRVFDPGRLVAASSADWWRPTRTLDDVLVDALRSRFH